jgi:hypothetical protein
VKGWFNASKIRKKTTKAKNTTLPVAGPFMFGLKLDYFKMRGFKTEVSEFIFKTVEYFFSHKGRKARSSHRQKISALVPWWQNISKTNLIFRRLNIFLATKAGRHEG